MNTLTNSRVTIKVIEVHAYGIIGLHHDCRVYVDLIELSWIAPIPESAIPKVGDEIEVLIDPRSIRPDSNYLGSVKYLYLEQNPWHNPSAYKIGDSFIGEITEVSSFGCWALHPNGASALIRVDGNARGIKVRDKVRLKIIATDSSKELIDVELINLILHNVDFSK